jgi:hypothetical protein
VKCGVLYHVKSVLQEWDENFNDHCESCISWLLNAIAMQIRSSEALAMTIEEIKEEIQKRAENN